MLQEKKQQIMGVEKKIRKQIEKPFVKKFMYIRDADGRPKWTFCFLMDKNAIKKDRKILAAGMSIWNEHECIKKERGKKFARRRAIKAFYTKKNDENIARKEVVMPPIEGFGKNSVFYQFIVLKMKSIFNSSDVN